MQNVNVDQKIVQYRHVWDRQDSLTAWESQTMTFKSFDVGAKAIQCQKSD